MFGLTDTDFVVTDLRHKEIVAKAEHRSRFTWDQVTAPKSIGCAKDRISALKMRIAALVRQPGRSLPAKTLTQSITSGETTI